MFWALLDVSYAGVADKTRFPWITAAQTRFTDWTRVQSIPEVRMYSYWDRPN